MSLFLQHRRELRWSYISFFAFSVAQVASTVIMTRLVAPAEFGIVALAMFCVRFANYFSQLGISRAVIQRPNLDERHIRAAFTLCLGLGGVVTLITAGMAPLMARLFHQPRLTWMLMVYASTFLFQGASLVSAGLLRRRLKMRELALIDNGSYCVASFVISVPMALAGLGAWSVIVGLVAQMAFTSIFYFVSAPHSLRLTFRTDDYREIVDFGAKATFVSIIESLTGSVDTIMLGRFATAEMLGLYNRSYYLITLPIQYFSNGMTRVLFTTLSRAAASSLKEAFKQLRESQRLMIAVSFPVCFGAAAASRTIVLSMFGGRWTGAIAVFPVLCAATAAQIAGHLPAVYLEAIARFRHKTAIQVASLIFLVAGVYLMLRYGIVGVAAALALLELLRAVALNYFGAKIVNESPWSLFAEWLPGVQASIVVTLINVALQSLFKIVSMPIVVQLLICLSASAVGLIGFYRLFYSSDIYSTLAGMVHRRQERTVAAQVSA